jgi:hypothetical protein
VQQKNGAEAKVVCFFEDITEKRSRHRKSVLSSIPGEYVFSSSETKHDRRTAPMPRFCFAWKITGTKTTIPEMSPRFESR